jgi:hypothetical protein
MNWTLASKDELKIELFDRYGGMYIARGWPTTVSYWSTTPDGPRYYHVNLNVGRVSGSGQENAFYASCVSVP